MLKESLWKYGGWKWSQSLIICSKICIVVKGYVSILDIGFTDLSSTVAADFVVLTFSSLTVTARTRIVFTKCLLWKLLVLSWWWTRTLTSIGQLECTKSSTRVMKKDKKMILLVATHTHTDSDVVMVKARETGDFQELQIKGLYCESTE